MKPIARMILSGASICMAAACATALSAGMASAQTYPERAVQIIVDSAPGSANDATARILSDSLSKLWKHQAIVVNHPGAGGSISARAASVARPDGYTLYLPATSPFLALKGAPGVAPNLPIELPRDFEAISFVLQQPLFIASSLESGIKTVADIIERAKANPGKVAYAATGVGRLTHLTMELLQSRADIQLQLIPYAGGPAQAMGDVITGRVPLMLDGYGGLAGAILGGKVHGVASTSDKRLPGLEKVPSVAETVPGFFVGAWNVMLAPKGTPPAIIKKVNADLRVVLDDPKVQVQLAKNGAFVRYMEPQQVIDFVQSEQKTWRPILERVKRTATKK